MTRSCGECGGPHYARGRCRAHYLEAMRAGEFVAHGPGRRVGTSTLSAEAQGRIAHGLIEGFSLSVIARSEGVSRDQVRTVRSYLERLNA